jgi:hypothetical protein
VPPFKESAVFLLDPFGLKWIGLQIPNVAFESAPQKNSVISRNHASAMGSGLEKSLFAAQK